MKQNLVRILIIPVLLSLSGCFDSSLNFEVRYAEVSGLKKNDPVYFEQNKIGKVEKVMYTEQGDYLVEIDIAPEFKNAATVDSRFFIDYDPADRQNKAITILQERPGGGLLPEGAVVQGSIRSGFLNDMISGLQQNATVAENEMRRAIQQVAESLNAGSEKLDKEMTGALDNLSRQFHSFREELKKVPDSEEVKQLEDSIKRFADEFDHAQSSARDQIRDEVIPQLKRELDRLRRQLHEEGRDEEIEVIDQRVQEMVRV